MVTVGENCPYACRSSGLPSFPPPPPISGLDSIGGTLDLAQFQKDLTLVPLVERFSLRRRAGPGERINLVSRSANRILKIFSKLLESIPQTPTPLSHLLITLSRLLYSSLV